MSGNGSKSSSIGGVQPCNPLATALQLPIGGKHQEAIGTLREVLASEPNNKEALQQHNEVAKARQPAQRLVAQEPEHPVLNRVLARCDKRNAQPAAAIERLARVIESNQAASGDFWLHY